MPTRSRYRLARELIPTARRHRRIQQKTIKKDEHKIETNLNALTKRKTKRKEERAHDEQNKLFTQKRLRHQLIWWHQELIQKPERSNW